MAWSLSYGLVPELLVLIPLKLVARTCQIDGEMADTATSPYLTRRRYERDCRRHCPTPVANPQVFSMTVMPNAQTKAGQSPRWLRVLTGVLLFPALWLGIAVAFDAAVPLARSGALAPAIWLPPTALLAGFVAWLVIRRATTRRLAPLVAIVLVAYGAAAVWLTALPTRSPRSTQTAEIPGAPPPDAKPVETAEAPRPLPPPPPPASQPTPAPSPTGPPAKGGSSGGASPGGGADGSRPGAGAEPIPQFPWPPPAASATYVLPGSQFERGLTIGQVVTTIITALERKGYVERSFFATPADGVVLVTRLERINEDGSSAADMQRWPAVGEAARSSAGFAQFLRGLFYVDPGRYRVIVFVLQDSPFRQSSEQITGQQARAWLRTGANVLPRELAERAYTGDCTVLVYEFASDGTAVRVVESRLTGREHLEKAGVLATLGRAN